MSIIRASSLCVLASAFLLSLVLFSGGPTFAQSGATNTATWAVQVQVNPVYDFYGAGAPEVGVVIQAPSLSPGNGTIIHLQTSFPASIQGSSGNASGGSLPISYTPLGKVSGIYGYDITVPANATGFLITAQGFEGGDGFLWRYVVGAPYVSVTSPSPLITFSNAGTTMSVPEDTVLSQLYNPIGESLPSDYATLSSTGTGQATYALSYDVGIVVMQSTLFLPGSIAITISALVVLVLVALNFLPSGRRLFAGIKGRIGRLRPGNGGMRISTIRLRAILRPRTLLVLFILCSLVMVAGAAMGGPAPRDTAYVMAAPASVSLIQQSLQRVAPGIQIVTPSQDFTDFAVMSSVGQFNIVVISNLPTPDVAEDGPFILTGLSNVPVIILDSQAVPSFANQVTSLYNDTGSLVIVHNASNLTVSETREISFLLSQSQRSNILGLSISPGEFKYLSAGEAVLSMLLVFVGWTYLGSLAAKPESWRDFEHIVTVIGAGVFVFVYSEVVYVATSSLLAFPVSLHAVNSGAQITAISLLGFGGGSTPRLAVGFLGVIVGLVGTEGGVSIRKTEFALVAAVALILVASPFSIGQFVFQALLLFFPLSNVGPYTNQLGAAYASSISLKGFIYGVGSALGGGVTPQYLLSAGKVLFFGGLVPLAYLKKLGRFTTVIGVLAVALLVGDGGVRVGEMTPDKTFAAILPGLILGFAFAAVILGLAVFEKYVRGHWKFRG